MEEWLGDFGEQVGVARGAKATDDGGEEEEREGEGCEECVGVEPVGRDASGGMLEEEVNLRRWP